MPSIPVQGPGGVQHSLVDDEDADLLTLSWSLAGGKAPKGEVNHGKYVATFRVVAGARRTILLHRVIAARMGLVSDPFEVAPSQGQGRWTYSIDHINGDKRDNRRANLRLRDRRQQMSNLNDSLRVNNTSGHRGVYFIKGRAGGKPWQAKIMESGRSLSLGWFATAQEAAAARRSYDDAPDKAAWLAACKQRDLGKTGHRSVTLIDGRFFASATEAGRKVALGGYDTAEEAAAARESYLSAPDRNAWLLAHRIGAPQSNGSSGHRGVSFLKQVRHHQWLAYATVKGKRFNLGRYETAEEAAKARRDFDEQQAMAASA